MKKLLHCKNLPTRLCGRRKVLSARKLLWMLAFSCVLVLVLALHDYAFGYRISTSLGQQKLILVYQQNHSGSEVKLHLNVSTITLKINKTGQFVNTGTPTVVAQQTAKTNNIDWSYKNVSNYTVPSDCQNWCRQRKENSSKPFFLTAVLLVRVYVKDLAQLTTRELRQWIYYLRYAGFQHVYVYDAFVLKNESQAQALKPLIDEGFVTYTDWSHKAYPYSIAGTQHSAYQDCINRFGHETQWQAAIDIDEYPFSPADQQPLFAQRAIARFSEKEPDVSELTMQNYLFLGKPLDDNKHPLLIDRIWRRTHEPANALVKPIYRPSHVSAAIVHHNALARGTSRSFPVDQLRMNHYWGARLQNWGEDTPEIIAKTQQDNSMESIVKTLQSCIGQCLPNADFVYKKQWT